ncbi:MAG: hypothetical protein PHZ03_07935 [Syntrophomonas sp.]|nr:hypothetical protein [Syntrophomonas sp.]
MIALLLIGFGIVALTQIPGLVRKQWWRELICFAVLWSMGLILSLMISMGITLPPISTIIGKSLTGMFGI